MPKKTDIVSSEDAQIVEGRETRSSQGVVDDAPVLAARGLIGLSVWLLKHPMALLATAAVLALVVLYLVLAAIVFLAVVALTAAVFIYAGLRFGLHRPNL